MVNWSRSFGHGDLLVLTPNGKCHPSVTLLFWRWFTMLGLKELDWKVKNILQPTTVPFLKKCSTCFLSCRRPAIRCQQWYRQAPLATAESTLLDFLRGHGFFKARIRYKHLRAVFKEELRGGCLGYPFLVVFSLVLQIQYGAKNGPTFRLRAWVLWASSDAVRCGVND